MRFFHNMDNSAFESIVDYRIKEYLKKDEFSKSLTSKKKESFFKRIFRKILGV